MDSNIQARLEYLRGEIRAERISYGEIAELQELVAHIDPDDVELLSWAESENDREAVPVVLSGRAYRQAQEGGWPKDNPRGYAALQAGEWRTVGKGTQWRGEMRRDDAVDLGEYLLSVADVWECMTAEERGSDDPRPIRKAAEQLLAFGAEHDH